MNFDVSSKTGISATFACNLSNWALYHWHTLAYNTKKIAREFDKASKRKCWNMAKTFHEGKSPSVEPGNHLWNIGGLVGSNCKLYPKYAPSAPNNPVQPTNLVFVTIQRSLDRCLRNSGVAKTASSNLLYDKSAWVRSL